MFFLAWPWFQLLFEITYNLSNTEKRVPRQGSCQFLPCHNRLKPVRTPVAILGSLGVCIYVPASRHWLISYSPIHLT